MQPLRIVFMGTPEFAATILKGLMQDDGQKWQVVAVYSQPDRPAGRGHKLMASAVKTLAQEYDLPVLQPLNFKDPINIAKLQAWQPDVLVIAAYGLILPQAVLDIPRLGPYNVHASLLPRYRGAAPIQRAIMNEDPVTGITIMRVELGLDSGPIVLQRALGIGMDDTTGSLTQELAELGTSLMQEVLTDIQQGKTLSIISQNPEQVTIAKKISKQDGEIDWSKSAKKIHAQVRAVMPWPLARASLLTKNEDNNKALDSKIPTKLDVIFPPGRILELHTGSGNSPNSVDGNSPNSAGGNSPNSVEVSSVKAEICDNSIKSVSSIVRAGTILGLRGDCIGIACGDGVYGLTSLTLAGKKPLTAVQFWAGYGKYF